MWRGFWVHNGTAALIDGVSESSDVRYAQLHEIFFIKGVCIHFDPRGKGSKGREVVKGSLLYFSLTRNSHTSPSLSNSTIPAVTTLVYLSPEKRVFWILPDRERVNEIAAQIIFSTFFSFFLSFPSPAEAAGLHDSGGRGHATPRHATHAHVLYCTEVRHFQPPPGPKRFLSLFPIFFVFFGYNYTALN